MKVIKSSLIYLLSSVLAKSAPLLLLPIMTKYLSPKEYGILSLFLIIVAFYSAIIGMNMNINISRNYFKISKYELSLYVGNIFYILFFTFSSSLIITYLISIYVDSLFSIPTSWLLFIPVICIMLMISNLNTTLLRNEQRVYLFGLFEISNVFIKVGFTVIFLVIFGLGWYSQVLGSLIAGLIFSIFSILYMKKNNYLQFTFNIEKVKSILKISIPLIPHILGAIIIGMSDRIFIEKMVSIEAVGIYSVGYMFGMIVVLFIDSFIKAWSPWFYKSLVQPTAKIKQKIIKYTYIYIISIFLVTIFISIVGEFILPYLINERFYGAGEFILWISLGYTVQGIHKILFLYLVHIDRTFFLALSTVMAAILNLLFNYILIDRFGTIGAAYATILAFVVSTVLVFWYQNKYFYMPWLYFLNRSSID